MTSNQTVRNGLKAKKIKLPQMNFFCRKTTNKISMYLFAPFFLQNFKKTLWIDPELCGCAIFGSKMAHLPLTISFWYKPLLFLWSTYWFFSLCKILKNSYSRSRDMTMRHFCAQNGPFAPNNVFLENYYYHCHLPISPFHCANLKKKFVQRIQSSQDVQSLGPKPPISANENFFQKTC